MAGFILDQIFTGEHLAIAKTRQAAMDRAYEQNPERFTKGRPLVAMPPMVVEINPVTEQDEGDKLKSDVNLPTLSRAIANAI